MNNNGKDERDEFHIHLFLKKFFKDHPEYIIGYVFQLICYPIGIVVLPWCMGKIMDALKNEVDFHEWKHYVVILIVAFIFILISYLVGSFLDQKMYENLRADIQTLITNEILESYSHGYQTLETSKINSKILKFPYSISDIIHKIRNTLIPGILTLLVVFGYFMFVDYRLGILLLSMVIIIGGIMALNAWVTRPGMIASKIYANHQDEKIGDILDNLEHILLVDGKNQEVTNIVKLNKSRQENSTKYANRSKLMITLLKVFIALVIIIIFVFAFQQYQNKVITAGQIVSILLVLMASKGALFDSMIQWPKILELSCGYHLLQREMTMLNEYKKTEDTHYDERKDLSTEEIIALQNSCDLGIEFEKVSFGYVKDKLILKNISFQIPKGQSMLIRGRIGCGKSTIGKLILGYFGTYSGDIKICGYDVGQLTRKSISRLAFYVNANPSILNRTLFDYFKVGLPDLTKEEAQEAITKFGIDYVTLDTQLGKHGGTMSTGQKLKVALVKSFLMKTPIIIVDEITSNLDPDTKAQVLQFLKEITRDKTLIYISHDRHLDFQFNKTIVIDCGRIVPS